MGNQYGRREVLGALAASTFTAATGCLGQAGSNPDTTETGFKSYDGACSLPAGTQSKDGAWLLPRGDIANMARAQDGLASDDTPLEVAWEMAVGTKPVGTPVSTGKTVIARRPDPDGIIAAVDAMSGKRTWQQRRDELASSVGIADNTVYASYEFHDETAGVGVSAFDLATGEKRWHTSDMGSTNLVVPTGEALLIGNGNDLLGYDGEAQSTCWRYHPKGSKAMVTGVATRDRTVYAAITTHSSDVPDGGAVVALDPVDGIQWRMSFDDPATGVTAGQDRIFVRHSGGVLAVERATGAVDWRVETGGDPDHGMALANDALVVGGYYALLAVDPSSGDRLWIQEYEATEFSPVVAGDVIVATGRNHSSGEGSLVVLDGAGETRWQTSIAGGTEVSPPAVSGSQVYVGAADGRVIAFKPK